MPDVVIRPRALADLAEIWVYIAVNSTTQADKFIDLIDRKFQTLARRPGVGRRRPELDANLRSLAVGKYVVFYASRAEGAEIIRVLHGARDLQSFLDDQE